MSKKTDVKDSEAADVIRETAGFIRDNIRSASEETQGDVIESLGFLWQFRNPPEECSGDILLAKIALMDIVGARDTYPNFTEKAKHKAVNVIWDCVQDYAHKCIHRYARTYVNTGNAVLNRENVLGMEAEMWISTAQYIHTYDPDRAQPLTFLKQCFMHGIFEWKKKKSSIGANPSVTGLVKRIAHISASLEAENREVNLQVLHEMMPTQSLDSIQTALITLEASNNMASLEACSDLMASRAGSMAMPEETALQKEKNDEFYDCLIKLPKEELAVYCLVNGIDITDRSVSLTPRSSTAISKLMGIPVTRVTFLVSKAEQDMYAMLTGHRRNDRLSPNHRPDDIIRSSCDEIHFLAGDDGFVDDELAGLAALANERPAEAASSPDDIPSGILAESL